MDKSTLKYRIEGDAEPANVPIGPLVRKYFAAMDAEELPWAVLRGSDGLPDYTRYDIDILLSSAEDIDKSERLLEKAVREEGWSMFRIIDKFAYRCCMLISPGPERRYLPIDLFAGCHHRFYPIADGAYGLDKRRRNEASIAVVPPGFGAAVALLKELTRHPTFKENSRDEMTAGVRDDPESFLVGVKGILSEGLANRLLDACRSSDWDGVAALVPEIRQNVQGTRSYLSGDALKFFASSLRHHLKPPMNGFVVLLGPDGSGKSTIADLVGKELYKKPFKICQRYEYNFRILPELKQFKAMLSRLAGRRIAEQKRPEPGERGSGMNKDHGMLKGMLYVSYYALDFILGRKPLFSLRAQGSLCLFARYFQDYFYQRGYGNVPKWYLRFLERLVPKPDLILYLDRDADEIYQGKPELDVDEIRRQQGIIRELVEKRSHAEVIDASMGIDRTVEQVKERIERIFLSKVDQ